MRFERKAGEPEGIYQQDNMLLIGQPDWAIHPITGVKLYFKDRYTTTAKCPKHGAEDTLKVSHFKDDSVICIECPTCKEFIWCQ